MGVCVMPVLRLYLSIVKLLLPDTPLAVLEHQLVRGGFHHLDLVEAQGSLEVPVVPVDEAPPLGTGRGDALPVGAVGVLHRDGHAVDADVRLAVGLGFGLGRCGRARRWLILAG